MFSIRNKAAKSQGDKLSGMCDRLLNKIMDHREANEGQLDKKGQMPKFFEKSDTDSLVATYTRGVGLTNLILPGKTAF